MQDIYQSFEFNKIKDFILEFAKTERGINLVLNLSFSSDEKEIKYQLSILKERSNL